MQIDPRQLAANSTIPAQAFGADEISLRADQYVEFWAAVAAVEGVRGIAYRVCSHLALNRFDPRLFVFLCSGAPMASLQRLRLFRLQTSPLGFQISVEGDVTSFEFGLADTSQTPHQSIASLCDMTIVIRLLQLASGDNLRPLRVELPCSPTVYDGLEASYHCPVLQGSGLRVRYQTAALHQPFTVDVENIWYFFENRFGPFGGMGPGASYADRIRAALMVSLPSGRFSVEQLAVALNTSKRTIQRRLQDEGLRYQAVLQMLRLQLADHYLTRSRMGFAEIAQLLGFANRQSFVRAYSIWTGRQPRTVRRLQRSDAQAKS